MILVFAGAGASAAVDADKYPTTEEFLKRIPSDIRSHRWFVNVNSFLDSKYSESTKDIELVIDALSELQQFFSAALEDGTFPNWVLASGLRHLVRLSDAIHNSSDPRGNLLPTLEANSSSLDHLQSAINALVFDLYAASPSFESMDTWTDLLRELARRGLHTEVFTTNYDLVLENVIAREEVNSVRAGTVHDGVCLQLDLEQWPTSLDDSTHDNTTGLLTKLHGSVNWQRDNDERFIIGSSHFTGQHRNHILIYPGFKGEPQDEPFITFHNHLRLVAERAQAAIFIGYAFRDEYINETLSSLPPNIPRVVIDVAQSEPKQGFLRGCMYLGDGFSDETATAAINYLTDSGVFTE